MKHTQVWNAISYLLFISISSFFIGRVLPYKWFNYNKFPYKSFKFEKNGRVYLQLRINKWHNKVPDMSRIFPQLMPPKKMSEDSLEVFDVMIRETCIAEFTHAMLCVFALHTLRILPGLGGVLITSIYIFIGNVPFCLIQRYNRPRFIKLMHRIEARKEKESCIH